MSSRNGHPRQDDGLFANQELSGGVGAQTTNETGEAGEAGQPAEPAEPAGVLPVAIEAEPAEMPTPGRRSPSLRVASLHLRMGQHALARAELEAFAGRGRLDEQALLDLAEVRWRSGDLVGATEAAAALLAGGHEPLLALVIAAEGFANTGRTTEARRLALRAVALAGDGLESVFAGMPSGRVWPDGSVSGEAKAVEAGVAQAEVAEGEPGGDLELATLAMPRAAIAEPAPALTSAGNLPPHLAADAAVPSPSPADSAIAAAAIAMEHGRIDQASLLFGLALRLDPGSAAEVLVHLDAPTSDPRLALVEGDALQLLGRQAEAREAFIRASGHLFGSDTSL